mmetsp:Transcript_20181/g.35900  ORF Transcript_20181/g.35900 Transcript_20181/m.35900 type:complete len:131 (+) Transcript_20181:1690-2082(+)
MVKANPQLKGDSCLEDSARLKDDPQLKEDTGKAHGHPQKQVVSHLGALHLSVDPHLISSPLIWVHRMKDEHHLRGSHLYDETPRRGCCLLDDALPKGSPLQDVALRKEDGPQKEDDRDHLTGRTPHTLRT